MSRIKMRSSNYIIQYKQRGRRRRRFALRAKFARERQPSLRSNMRAAQSRVRRAKVAPSDQSIAPNAKRTRALERNWRRTRCRRRLFNRVDVRLAPVAWSGRCCCRAKEVKNQLTATCNSDVGASSTATSLCSSIIIALFPTKITPSFAP